MLLLDFIISQMFKSRNTQVKKDDVVRLVSSINGVIDVFKQVSNNIEESRNRQVMRIPVKTDDTFN